jgi:hypothetical protein
MSTMTLFAGGDWWPPDTRKMFEELKVRMPDPYSVVANIVWQNTKTGRTHLAMFNGKASPMFMCGHNSNRRPLPTTKVSGPTRVTCCKCVLFAISRLLADGKLGGSR